MIAPYNTDLLAAFHQKSRWGVSLYPFNNFVPLCLVFTRKYCPLKTHAKKANCEFSTFNLFYKLKVCKTKFAFLCILKVLPKKSANE